MESGRRPFSLVKRTRKLILSDVGVRTLVDAQTAVLCYSDDMMLVVSACSSPRALAEVHNAVGCIHPTQINT